MKQSGNLYDKTLKEIILFFEQNKIEYLVIGGIAVSVYYQARTTIDIDFIVSFKKNQGAELLNKLKEDGFFYDDSAETDIKVKGAFRIIKNDIQIDIILKSLSFEEDAFKRKKKVKVLDVEFYIPTVEDVVLYKLFAARERDILDIKNILKGNIETIDLDYIKKWTQNVCDEAQDIIYWNILNKILKEIH